MERDDYLTMIRSMAKSLRTLINNGAKIPQIQYVTFVEILESHYLQEKADDIKAELKALINFFKDHDVIARILYELKVYSHKLGIYSGKLVYPILNDQRATIELGGFRYHYMIPEVLESFKQFSDTSNIKIPQGINAAIITALEDAQNSLTEENLAQAATKYLYKYNNKQPIILATGWSEHAVCIVIYKDKLIICNKGQGSDQNICSQIYKIGDIEQLNLEVMSRLLNAQHHGYFPDASPYTTMNYMLSELKSVLSLQLIEGIQGKNQKEPICVNTSLKTAIKMTLKILLDEENASNQDNDEYTPINYREYYKQWTQRDRQISFDRLLELYNKKLVNKDVLDELLLRTALVQNDPNKPQEYARFLKILQTVDFKKHMPLITNLLWQEQLDNIILPGYSKKLHLIKRAINAAKLELVPTNLSALDSKHPLYPLALNNQMLDAIRDKDYENIEKLLLLGSKNNFFGRKILNEAFGPLHYAVVNNDKTVLELFVKHKINPLQYPGMPLVQLASYTGKKDILMFLFQLHQNKDLKDTPSVKLQPRQDAAQDNKAITAMYGSKIWTRVSSLKYLNHGQTSAHTIRRKA